MFRFSQRLRSILKGQDEAALAQLDLYDIEIEDAISNTGGVVSWHGDFSSTSLTADTNTVVHVMNGTPATGMLVRGTVTFTPATGVTQIYVYIYRGVDDSGTFVGYGYWATTGGGIVEDVGLQVLTITAEGIDTAASTAETQYALIALLVNGGGSYENPTFSLTPTLVDS